MNDKHIQLDDLIGKPYAANGRGPGAFDCWGLALEIASRLGRYLPEYDTPKDAEQCSELFVSIKDLKFEKLDKPEPWCLIAFRIFDEHGKEKWHCGTMLADCRRFIHITEKTCVCTSRLSDEFWSLHTEGFYRYRG